MRKPKLSNLRVNEEETQRIRNIVKRSTGIKITINIDKEVLKGVKAIAVKTGIPYQRLINRLLSTSLESNLADSNRLDRIEAELEEIKKKIAA